MSAAVGEKAVEDEEGKRMNRQWLLVLTIAVVSTVTGAAAHHGTSITYEMDKTITVSGIVDEFDFGYPHPTLFVDVKDDKGQMVKWGVEFLPTPAALRDMGWTKTSIKRGDTVVMGCSPSRSGKPVCALRTLTVNGKTAALGAGPPPAGAPGGTQRGPRE
jgi:hypothetical protein